MCRVILLLALGITLDVVRPPRSDAAEVASVPENQLKAAILPKLPLFIKWPDSAFASPTSPLRIGILGDHPFGTHLQDAVKKRKAGGREITLETCHTVADAASCHVVFLCSPVSRDSLRELDKRSVLTVSDAEGFSGVGGMIELLSEDHKIVLQVNAAAIQSAGLRADPQLLRLARPVSPNPHGAKR